MNDDCFCNECQLLSRAVLKIGNLFYKKALAFRPEGAVNSIRLLYGITINLSPFKKMNKKTWYTYSHDQQIAILARIENKFRQLTPSVKMHELHFEKAPAVDNCHKFRNMHIHALYEMPSEYASEMETYYIRICKDPTSNWKHLDIRLLYDKQGWIDYIRKDVLK